MKAQALSVLILLTLACKQEAPSKTDTSASARILTAASDTAIPGSAMTLKVTSSAFQQGSSIPSQYTCDGNDTSPPLAWSGAAKSAKTFALIVDDPDAPDPAKPQRVYVHWVIYNIPAATSSLPENASKSGMPNGALQGKNDWGKPEDGGPCPPIGRHRHFFKPYALDTELSGFVWPGKAGFGAGVKGELRGS